jgi:hypothetical protein
VHLRDSPPQVTAVEPTALEVPVRISSRRIGHAPGEEKRARRIVADEEEEGTIDDEHVAAGHARNTTAVAAAAVVPWSSTSMFA